MFEKEAEKLFKKKATRIAEKKVKEFYKECGWEDYKYMIPEFADVGTKCMQKGAEFGYNKANEWHYVKDGLPKDNEYVLIYTDLNNCYVAKKVENHFMSKGWGFIPMSTVVAWKEIVLPKESE